MKYSCETLVFFIFMTFVAVTTSSGIVEENEQQQPPPPSSLFERSSLFFNNDFLCLPIDGCKATSRVLECAQDGDLCAGDNSVCVRTTEGAKLCASVDTSGDTPCQDSSDCGRGEICVTFNGECRENGCLKQKRGRG